MYGTVITSIINDTCTFVATGQSETADTACVYMRTAGITCLGLMFWLSFTKSFTCQMALDLYVVISPCSLVIIYSISVFVM